MNFVNLLAEGTAGNNVMIYILLGVMIVILIAGYFFSMRSSKKRQEQTNNMLAKIQVGTEIKTIGGIIGTVVNVDREGGTFVIQTGNGDNVSYMKIDKLAIYSADVPQGAAPEKAEEAEVPAEVQPTEEKAEESFSVLPSEPAEVPAEQPEEAKAEGKSEKSK